MTTEQTAQQLELAAQILRTGHPWEVWTVGQYEKPDQLTILDCIQRGHKIRLAPDPYAELKKAHAEGNKMEYFDGAHWNPIDSPSWICSPNHYRIKPESTFQLPPPPPGMQWHHTDGWQEGDEKKTDNKTIPDFSDNEILQLRNLLNIFSTYLTAEEKLNAIAAESLTWLARGGEAGRCAGAVMKIINPPKNG